MPTFTPVTASQTFTGADADPIGSNFTQLRDLGWGSVARIKSNKLAGHYATAGANDTTTQTRLVVYLWAGAGSFSADQYCTFTISNLAVSGASSRGGGIVRSASGTDAASAFYACYVCDDDTGSGSTVVILKVNGTMAGTVLDSRRLTIANGDILTFGVQGSSSAVLTLYVNAVASASTYTDSSSPLTTGKPGLYLASDESTGTLTGPALDDWIAGDVTAGSTSAALSGSALTGGSGTQAPGTTIGL
jgi:hypothetical protein